jgi:hypothetical protein
MIGEETVFIKTIIVFVVMQHMNLLVKDRNSKDQEKKKGAISVLKVHSAKLAILLCNVNNHVLLFFVYLLLDFLFIFILRLKFVYILFTK